MESFNTCESCSPALRALLAILLWTAAAGGADSFHFDVLGDRTGEAETGVYAQVWREMAEEHPAFVLSVGDSIQGLQDARADAEWQEFERMRAPFRKMLLYLTPGNHDIWSPASEDLYIRHAHHPVHYGFDYRQAHFTVLDNSRREQLSPEEMEFLEADLKSHSGQTVKVIVSHRPSWLVPVVLKDSHFALQEMAKKYGVKAVIAGHVHQMLHFELDGVTYLSAPSSGGHLRGSKAYADGWFFGHLRAEVAEGQITFEVRETGQPYGEGRKTAASAWGGVRGLIDGR